jgi:2-keto-4-pentenoate hydratase/2-oxohepta-3-ene-1,7-dioic acid hydratase in catechol pathway
MARWFRLLHNYRAYFAVPEGDNYRLLTRDPLEGAAVPTAEIIPAGQAALLTPVTPSKIIAVGLNYRSHAKEMKLPIPEDPILFFKPLTALIGPGAFIEVPPSSRQVEFEGELAVVIRKSGKNIPEANAEEWIFGYTLANDVTARDLQKKDTQWTRAKSFDTFCPLGPCIATGLSAADLEFRTLVNGEVRQFGRVTDMIFSIPKLISFISTVMTLAPGDVILTGTPPGVGQLRYGDTVRVECDAIGALENPVAPATEPTTGAHR